MVSCSVLTVNIGVVLAKTEESFGNLRLKIYLCHIIHLFSCLLYTSDAADEL